MPDFAEIPRSNEPLNLPVVGIEAQFMVNQVQAARLSRNVQQLPRLPRVQRHGLLAQDMGTSLQCGTRHSSMQISRCRHDHKVCMMARQHLLPIIVGMLYPEFAPNSPFAFQPGTSTATT